MRSDVFTRGLCTLIFCLLLLLDAFGQTQSLPPDLRRTPRNPDEAAYRQIQIQRTLEAQQRQAMRDAERNARATVTLPREKLPRLTEKDRKRIEALLTPNPEDVAANEALLDQPRTGIFRLFPNSDCESKRQIRVDGECANHVPGGSSYSFRSGALTPDIHFNNGLLIGEGFFSLAIVTELGDVPLLDLESSARGLAFLTGFEPSEDLLGARRQYAEIHKGIESGGKAYSNIATPKVNVTYAIRIVPYRNDNNLLRRTETEGITPDSAVNSFQTVQADNRFDLLVAFRIVRREADGNLTVVWKELDRRKSPLITFAKNEKLSDLK